MKRLYLVLTMIMCIVVVGCGAQTQTADDARKAVERSLNYYKENDFAEFSNTLTELPSTLDVRNSGKTETTIKAMTNINYNIKDARISGSKATVKVEIDVLYLPDVMNKYINQYLNAQISGELDDIEDEDEYANNLFESLLDDPDAKRETREIEIHLERSGDWKIVPDEAFVNVLMGLQNE